MGSISRNLSLLALALLATGASCKSKETTADRSEAGTTGAAATHVKVQLNWVPEPEFGGIYAAGVLGWRVTDVGVFGVLAAVTGSVFAWVGGRADARFGPKPVIAACVLVLTLVATAVVFVSRESVFGIAVASSSRLPEPSNSTRKCPSLAIPRAR